jgi:hypothetical protein
MVITDETEPKQSRVASGPKWGSDARRPQGAGMDDVELTLSAAGVIFIDENGEGPGVRLRKAGS